MAKAGRDLPPGFFVFENVQGRPDGESTAQVHQTVRLVPHDPDDPCPCGSGTPFGDCCELLGPGRVFVADSSGSYAPAMVHAEEWPGLPYAATRKALMAQPRLWCTEDEAQRCFWHYRPGGQAGGELFGTVELTPDRLALETLSEPRYLELRALLAQALAPLPAGRRQVSALVLDKAVDGVETFPIAAEDGEVPAWEQYLTWRPRLQAIYSAAIKELLRDEIILAAKHLGLAGPSGVLLFDSEDEADRVLDVALHEVRRHGRPVLGHYLRRHPPRDEEEALLYRAAESSWVSLFQIDQVTPAGVVVRDLLAEGRPAYRLMDNSLVQTAEPGVGLVTRLVPTPRFVMIAGGGLVVPAEQIPDVLREKERLWRQDSARTRLVAWMRYCVRTCRPLAVPRSSP